LQTRQNKPNAGAGRKRWCQVAQNAFPKGNMSMTMRDPLGTVLCGRNPSPPSSFRLALHARTRQWAQPRAMRSVLSRQGRSRRRDDLEAPPQEVAAWERSRSARLHTVQWQVTTADARTKRKGLSPKSKNKTLRNLQIAMLLICYRKRGIYRECVRTPHPLWVWQFTKPPPQE